MRPIEQLHPLLAAYVRVSRVAGHSEATVTNRVELVDRLLREVGDPLAVTSGQIVDWFAGQSLSRWSLAGYDGHLRSFFKFLVQFDHRADNPMDRLTAPKAPRGAPKPVTDKQLREALERSEGTRWKLVITLAAFAGLRASEIARLRREDVTEDTITVWGGKGSKDAALPCHPAIWALVEPMPGGLLVRSRTGRPFVGDMMSVMARHHFNAIGMPDVHLHRFRHYFATMLLRDRGRGGAGANLRVTQELMRHSSPATTARYTGVTGGELRDAVNALREVT